MTKEQFLARWGSIYIYTPNFKTDLEAVIANEVAKAQPEKTNKIEITPHTLVEVNRAFRALKQDRNSYIHKVFSDDGVFDAMEEIRKMFDNYFAEQPQPQKPKGNCTTFDMSRLVDQEKTDFNPIAEAYEGGEKIRYKLWYKDCWIKKHSKTQSIDEKGVISEYDWNIDTDREEWEIYTEPAKQPAKPFDKERFEAMFRAVVASGAGNLWSSVFDITNQALKQLDAYYATKEGGNNG